MKRRTRINFSDAQKAQMWERWQRGESLKSTGRLLDRGSGSIYGVLSVTGGIRPPARQPGIERIVLNPVSCQTIVS